MKKSGSGPNLTQKTFLNAAASLLKYGSSIVVGLVLTPLLLSLLGQSLFGTWKICQRLLTYMSATDGRASQALKWTIANRRSTTDVAQKQREIGCAVVIWLRFLPFVVLAGSLLSWFSPFFIRGLPAEHVLLTRLTCGVLVVNLFLFPLKSIPESVMVGMNLGYKTTWINVFGTVLGGILMAVAAWIGWGPVGLAAALFLASLVRAGMIFFIARRSLPWLAFQKPERSEIRVFFSFSIWILSWTLVNKFLLSSDIIILGLVSSASQVASYVITYYVIQTSIHLSAILVSAGMPGLGDIVGKGEFKKAAEVRSEIMSISWLFAVSIGSVVLLCNRSFISLWVGPGQFVGFWENLLMVLLMTQLIFIRNDAFIVDVTLNVKAKVLWGAFSTTLSLLLAFLFANYLLPKVAGVLLGLLTGRLILSVLYPILVGKTLRAGEQGVFKLTTSHVRAVGVMGILYGCAGYFAPLIGEQNWQELLLSVVIGLPVIGGAAFWLGLPMIQRHKLLSRVRMLDFK